MKEKDLEKKLIDIENSFLIALDQLRELRKEKIIIPLADIPKIEPLDRKISCRDISEIVLKNVVELWGWNMKDYKAIQDSRKFDVVMIRAMVNIILKDEFEFTFQEIGFAMKKDHSTIINSVKKGKDFQKQNMPFYAKKATCIRRLRELKILKTAI